MKKTIMVTGGAGFIGSNFVRYVYNRYRDYRIIVLDALTYAGCIENLPVNINEQNGERLVFWYGNVRNGELMDTLVSQSDIVVHFAAETHVTRSIYDNYVFFETDVLGTQTIANAVLTHYTAPVIVAFLAPVFLRERLTARVLVSVALATVGLWIMLGVSVPDFIRLVRAGDENTGGILSGLFSGFAYAVLIITFRVLAQNFHPLVMTFFQNSMIALLLLPFVRVTGTVAVSDFWIFAAMGIVHSTIAPVLYFKGLGLVTSNRAAILGYLEPVCAIMLGVVFLGEAVTFKTVIGGIMILFSGYLTIKDKQEVRRRK